MRILVINNHGQFNHLIRRAIREKVETDLISNLTEPEKIDADGLILGGGPSLERAGRCEDYLRELQIPIISMSMGPYGSLTRMFGFAFGSALTFAVGQSSSAPGQVPIEDLRVVLEIVQRSLGGAQP